MTLIENANLVLVAYIVNYKITRYTLGIIHYT